MLNQTNGKSTYRLNPFFRHGFAFTGEMRGQRRRLHLIVVGPNAETTDFSRSRPLLTNPSLATGKHRAAMGQLLD